jgi:hypothetical protein
MAKGGRGDLEACFSMVVVDEAHQLKSSGTQGNELIRWLRADAVILATASIIPNSLVDADGYDENGSALVEDWDDGPNSTK